jgi:hypothetical protein
MVRVEPEGFAAGVRINSLLPQKSFRFLLLLKHFVHKPSLTFLCLPLSLEVAMTRKVEVRKEGDAWSVYAEGRLLQDGLDNESLALKVAAAVEKVETPYSGPQTATLDQ